MHSKTNASVLITSAAAFLALSGAWVAHARDSEQLHQRKARTVEFTDDEVAELNRRQDDLAIKDLSQRHNNAWPNYKLYMDRIMPPCVRAINEELLRLRGELADRPDLLNLWFIKKDVTSGNVYAMGRHNGRKGEFERLLGQLTSGDVEGTNPAALETIEVIVHLLTRYEEMFDSANSMTAGNYDWYVHNPDTDQYDVMFPDEAGLNIK